MDSAGSKILEHKDGGPEEGGLPEVALCPENWVCSTSLPLPACAPSLSPVDTKLVSMFGGHKCSEEGPG